MKLTIKCKWWVRWFYKNNLAGVTDRKRRVCVSTLAFFSSTQDGHQERYRLLQSLSKELNTPMSSVSLHTPKELNTPISSVSLHLSKELNTPMSSVSLHRLSIFPLSFCWKRNNCKRKPCEVQWQMRTWIGNGLKERAQHNTSSYPGVGEGFQLAD